MRDLTCRELIEFLDDYVADTLSPDARAEFDAHLAKCPHCVDYLKTYRETRTLSRGACEAAADGGAPSDVPEELVAAVLKAAKHST